MLGKYGGAKNDEDDHFSFFEIPSSSIFVLASKFSQISQNSAESCVVLVPKEQWFISENHNICRNKLKYQIISYERAYEEADQPIFEE